MREIPLTKGQVALVDDEDFERVNAFKWQATWAESIKSFYATHVFPDRSRVFMHRFIMNTPPDMICDHRDHNTLNNQRSNLRNCTWSQNNMNSKVRSDNRLGIKGVHKKKTRYNARLQANGKCVLNKSFATIEEAVAAYEEAVKKYHGEFANSIKPM